MNKSTQTDKRLIQKRAHAKLIITLTDRDDLALQNVDDDYGHYVCWISTNGSLNTNRRFGIDLKAAMSATRGPSVRIATEEMERYSKSELPLCLFFYVMHGNKGYYTWMVKPSLAPNGQPLLSLNARLQEPVKSVTLGAKDFTELNVESLENLVASINDWYDAVDLAHREAA